MITPFNEVHGCWASLSLPTNQPSKPASLPVDGGVGGGADVKGVVLVVLQFMFICWVLLAGHKDLPGLKHTSGQNEVKDNGVTRGWGRGHESRGGWRTQTLYFTWSVIRLSNLYLFRWQKSAKTALDFASALCSSDRVGFCCAVAELTTLHRTACLCVTLHLTVDSNKWGTWGCMCGSSVLVAWGFSPVAQNSALWNKSHRCTNAYIHTQTSRKISYPQTAVLLLWWCGTILTFPGNVFCLGIAGDSGVNTDLRYACFML